MLKLMTSLLALALSLSALPIHAQDSTGEQPQMIIEVASPYGFEETDQRIAEGVATEGWKVPKLYDWQAIAKAGGHDPGPFKMYDLCKAPLAAQILKHEDLRFVSTLMPCSTAVYTKSDGRTYIAYLNVDLLAQMFGERLAPVAKQAGEARARALSFLHE
jgi:uncharacterized protein (DUF302 family)